MAAPGGLTAGVSGVNVANTAMLVTSWLDHVHDVAIERMDARFVVFSSSSCSPGCGWRWLARPWNLFNANIIALELE